MNEIVINCSAKHYNLGARKLFDWRKAMGASVEYYDGDPGLFALRPTKVWLSVVFSWHAPIAADLALRFSAISEVECGGPGVFALRNWWKEQTGMEVKLGLDARFENQPGRYAMTFASRGCPVGCYFCIVPKLEGLEFTLNRDFTPAPMLCDNNLSALPTDFQEFILRRYRETETRLLDANSGFEPITFDDGTYQRWKSQLRGPWRFAFDTMAEEPQVVRMMEILASESAKRKQVYCLIGNEPMEDCLYRARSIIERGGEPYCQPLMPLNALDREDISVRYDWTKQKLKDVARFFNRHLWRSMKLTDYKPRQNEAAFTI